jgi:hypothetical protein
VIPFRQIHTGIGTIGQFPMPHNVLVLQLFRSRINFGCRGIMWKSFRCAAARAIVAAGSNGRNTMRNSTRIALALSALAATVALAQPAAARRGADDPAGHVRQCRGCDDPAGHVRQGRGADDAPGDARRGRGADDAPGDVRGRGRGADDAPGHT